MKRLTLLLILIGAQIIVSKFIWDWGWVSIGLLLGGELGTLILLLLLKNRLRRHEY